MAAPADPSFDQQQLNAMSLDGMRQSVDRIAAGQEQMSQRIDQIATSVVAGRTVAETAATLGITRPTAKTHLEHIFSKTGVTRQAELMRLWTRLISPTGSNR